MHCQRTETRSQSSCHVRPPPLSCTFPASDLSHTKYHRHLRARHHQRSCDRDFHPVSSRATHTSRASEDCTSSQHSQLEQQTTAFANKIINSIATRHKHSNLSAACRSSPSHQTTMTVSNIITSGALPQPQTPPPCPRDLSTPPVPSQSTALDAPEPIEPHASSATLPRQSQPSVPPRRPSATPTVLTPSPTPRPFPVRSRSEPDPPATPAQLASAPPSNSPALPQQQPATQQPSRQQQSAPRSQPSHLPSLSQSPGPQLQHGVAATTPHQQRPATPRTSHPASLTPSAPTSRTASQGSTSPSTEPPNTADISSSLSTTAAPSTAHTMPPSRSGNLPPRHPTRATRSSSQRRRGSPRTPGAAAQTHDVPTVSAPQRQSATAPASSSDARQPENSTPAAVRRTPSQSATVAVHKAMQGSPFMLPQAKARLSQQLRYIENHNVTALKSHTSALRKLFVDTLQLQMKLPPNYRFHILFESESSSDTTTDLSQVDLFTLFSPTISNDTPARREINCLLGELLTDSKLQCYSEVSDNLTPPVPDQTPPTPPRTPSTPATAQATTANHPQVGPSQSEQPHTPATQRTVCPTAGSQQPQVAQQLNATVQDPLPGERAMAPDRVMAKMTLPSWFPSMPTAETQKTTPIVEDIDKFCQLTYVQTLYIYHSLIYTAYKKALSDSKRDDFDSFQGPGNFSHYYCFDHYTPPWFSESIICQINGKPMFDSPLHFAGVTIPQKKQMRSKTTSSVAMIQGVIAAFYSREPAFAKATVDYFLSECSSRCAASATPPTPSPATASTPTADSPRTASRSTGQHAAASSATHPTSQPSARTTQPVPQRMDITRQDGSGALLSSPSQRPNRRPELSVRGTQQVTPDEDDEVLVSATQQDDTRPPRQVAPRQPSVPTQEAAVRRAQAPTQLRRVNAQQKAVHQQSTSDSSPPRSPIAQALADIGTHMLRRSRKSGATVNNTAGSSSSMEDDSDGDSDFMPHAPGRGRRQQQNPIATPQTTAPSTRKRKAPTTSTERNRRAPSSSPSRKRRQLHSREIHTPEHRTTSSRPSMEIHGTAPALSTSRRNPHSSNYLQAGVARRKVTTPETAQRGPHHIGATPNSSLLNVPHVRQQSPRQQQHSTGTQSISLPSTQIPSTTPQPSHSQHPRQDTSRFTHDSASHRTLHQFTNSAGPARHSSTYPHDELPSLSIDQLLPHSSIPSDSADEQLDIT